ncbi:DNA helicase/exodeoxyribonuclease V, subunit B [Desulfonispora thiosulfatigenes DSM 11270]|uniref:ATP-dependent helicase/deoxyribonuclease subunit B n=1 Tax=Desulfonispora thiosulfatigenes DSM 11270 TaxID=656914 RepID=A0A1W1VTU5_DESTI|nr:PD-(D/E)XK nuclease family protein [Desulfonispora thiosulfatigenes]SMB96531.1 DNA helicase/exodeoxyribonuclease V, subunit B [Desulfonispora thiosulfatigenes DSM 11270]
MSFRFIVGRAGSGKSHQCLESIKNELKQSNEGRNLILLVPEQATFQNELELASAKGLEGIMRAEVLNFTRLTFRILQEVGGATRSHIDDLGKKMMIRKFLEARKSSLKVFKTASNKPGFVDNIASSISELKLYQVKLDDIQTLLDSFAEEKSLLSSKLSDLFYIYKDLEEYLTGKYVDPDDYLNLLAERVHLSTYIQNSEIWIDGFTGFTPQELNVIEALMKTAYRVNLTVTLNPLNMVENTKDVFEGAYKTYAKINEIINSNNIKTDQPILLDQKDIYRFKDSKALMYLEKNYFDYAQRSFNEEIKEDIKIVVAHNYQSEVEEIARQIRSLCRDSNYRYKDIGVYLRNFDNYDLLIETIFKLYEIPFFIDRKRTMMHHPVIELILSALNVVENGFNYEDLFRYLKTDLVNITRREVDILENKCLAQGIRKENFDQYPKGAITELLIFREEIQSSKSVKDNAEAIFNLLINLNIPQKLDNWVETARKMENIEKAREHLQIWDGVIDILDQLVETLGAEKLSLDSFNKIIFSGFENLKLALIPPGLDQVVIGSLERSRNPNLKAVFIMGILDGVLPAKLSKDGLFDDRERDLIKDRGINLAPGRKEKLNQEQFLIYTALTRASRKIILSYPLADSEGKALRPSLVINRIKELFPEIKEEIIGIDPSGNDDLRFISHPNKTLSYFGSKIRDLQDGLEVNNLWWAVYNWFLKDPYQEKLEKIIEGFNHKNEANPIPASIISKLYQNPLRISVSRIEKYHSCPFSHFLTYGLSLREREVYKFQSPDLGQFFHQAMEKFALELKNRGQDWADITKKQSEDIINNIANEITPTLQNQILLSSARYRFLTQKFQKTLQRSVSVLKEHARRGNFRPIGVEMNFGFNDTELPGLKFTLEEGSIMEVVGQIDRVDASISDEKCFLRVIDYKSGQAGLSLIEVYYGLKLQLLTYLDVVLSHFEKVMGEKEVLPAGVFYFYLRNPIIKANKPLSMEEIEEELLKSLKMNGLSLADIEVFQLTDQETSLGASPLIPVEINKEGQKVLKGENDIGSKDSKDLFTKRSKVVTKEQIKSIINYIRKLIINSGQEMLSGNVSLTPYQFKNASACTYCAFKTVCQFDTELNDNKYREIKDIKEEEIWERLKEV